MFVSDWWEHKRINEVVVDCYGNQMFWGVLKLLKSRGYYNNMAEKKKAMEGTYRNYGWQYSAEQYAMGRHADPKKYKDEVPENPDKAPFPKHITEKINQRQAAKPAIFIGGQEYGQPYYKSGAQRVCKADG